MTIAECFDECWEEDTDTGCWVWQRGCKGKEAKSGGGYGCFRLDGKTVAAHRYAYERVYGPLTRRQQIRHQCHNTKCVNPAHMLVGSNMQNARDRLLAGRYAKRIQPVTALQIKLLFLRGWRVRQLARYYELNEESVRDIIKERTWKHIGPSLPQRDGRLKMQA